MSGTSTVNTMTGSNVGLTTMSNCPHEISDRTTSRVVLWCHTTVHNSSERPSYLLILTCTYMYDIIVLFSPNTYLQKVCSEPAVRIMAIYTFF